MNLEKIDINGKSLNIRDGKAVHVDREDSLTEEEKAQARKNIGAAADGEQNGSAAETVIDMLITLDLVPAVTDADGSVLAESDGTILLNL